ncbi:MAG: D-alanyl-D-alanine carboxypeptidase/D-alanyl-D-alanine-endopeptidase [Prevotella sp.]|nr:D-alanyl-D-alanine carboxypeptidase/D-alanyl-D-alanine-endopeptidase [Prevotella sp.]
MHLSARYRNSETHSLKAFLLGTTLLLALAGHAQVTDNSTIVVETTDMMVADSPALPWPQSLVAEMDSLMGSDIFKTSQVGLEIYDLDADSILYRHGERQRLRPASTQKVITAITALDQLGTNYQYKTELRYTGTIADSTLTGSLYVVGGFDPCLGRDDLAALVECLQTAGIDTIRGSIYADRSMKGPELYGEGWCWDDDNPRLSPLLCGGSDFFIDRFTAKLTEKGITLFTTLGEGQCPSDAVTLCRQTRPIDQVLLTMMKESNNLYAESMFYQIAAASGHRPASAKDAAETIKSLIARIGLDSSEYSIADGSGLSLYNYSTAELQVAMLRYAYRNGDIFQHLRPSLPEAGIDGTLKSRMNSDVTRGRVFAKTGTLTGVSSLAGYAIAANGHMIAFSIINQGQRRAASARAFQDAVCTAICR